MRKNSLISVSVIFISIIIVLHFLLKGNVKSNISIARPLFSEKVVNNKKINNENEFISFYDYSNHGKEIFFRYDKELDKAEFFINSNIDDLKKDKDDLFYLINNLKSKKEISFGEDGDDLLLIIKDKKDILFIPYIKNEDKLLKVYLTFSYNLKEKENGVFEIN